MHFRRPSSPLLPAPCVSVYNNQHTEMYVYALALQRPFAVRPGCVSESRALLRAWLPACRLVCLFVNSSLLPVVSRIYREGERERESIASTEKNHV